MLSTRQFHAKSAAIGHFRAMLARYQVGERVNVCDAADLESLLDFHPFRYEIVWDNWTITHFEVQASDFGRKCFRVVFDNGSWSRFSYLKCMPQPVPLVPW